MLVLTRRPGEAILIGDHVEIMIVEADGLALEARCAISVCDADGNDLSLRRTRSANGKTALAFDETRGEHGN